MEIPYNHIKQEPADVHLDSVQDSEPIDMSMTSPVPVLLIPHSLHGGHIGEWSNWNNSFHDEHGKDCDSEGADCDNEEANKSHPTYIKSEPASPSDMNSLGLEKCMDMKIIGSVSSHCEVPVDHGQMRLTPSTSRGQGLGARSCRRLDRLSVMSHEEPAIMRNVECPTCGKRMKYYSLKIHKYRCRSDATLVTLKCDYPNCSLKFHSAKAFSVHVHTHRKNLTKRGSMYVCPFEKCAKVFKLRQEVENHVRYKHPNEYQYKCPHKDCTKGFKDFVNLLNHLQTSHTNVRKEFACQYCGRVFIEEHNLRNHHRNTCLKGPNSDAIQAVRKERKKRHAKSATCGYCRRVLFRRTWIKRHQLSGCKVLKARREALRTYLENSAEDGHGDGICLDLSKGRATGHATHQERNTASPPLLGTYTIMRLVEKKEADRSSSPGLSFREGADRGLEDCMLPKDCYPKMEDVKSEIVEQPDNEGSSGMRECSKCRQLLFEDDLPEHRVNCPRNAGFKCNYPNCDQTFEEASHLLGHVRTHKTHRKVTCPDCKKVLLQFSLRSHKKICLQRPSIPCDFPNCGRMFFRSSSYKNHVRSHGKVKIRKKNYVCSYENCGKQFQAEKELQYHINVHTGERPFKCPYEGCGKSYKQMPHVYYHLKAAHDSKKNKDPYVRCEHCSREFKRACDLTRHIKLNCVDGPYRETIREAMEKARKLRESPVVVRNEDKPFPCVHCMRRFLRKGDLTRHLRATHHVKAPSSKKGALSGGKCSNTKGDGNSLGPYKNIKTSEDEKQVQVNDNEKALDLSGYLHGDADKNG